jgi:hypothetical protein
LNQISLSGIHKELLSKQGNGLSKYIGNVFPDLSDKSAWLGGNGEAWERGPYYIDGLIPLAYLLNDKELISIANKWIDKILSSQQESGFFGPTKNLDWWPRAVVLKAMVSAYLATRNDDILAFVEKYLAYFLENIEAIPLDFWGYSRGMEGLEMVEFIQDRLTKDQVKEIKKALTDNSIDWEAYFLDFPYPEKTEAYMPKYLFRLVKYLTGVLDAIKKRRNKPPKIKKEKVLKSRSNKNNLVFLKTHGVNIAMALKYLLYWGEPPKVMFDGLDNVLSHHGNATGIFSSDEHLNGVSPHSGIELCTVVEMMYSMEETIRLTGNMEACDRLEKYAYNALLATIRPDFSSHQYVQQVNQFDCEVKPHPFYDAYRYANTFGIEPNYGCCAANMHQGWPKFMMSAVMKSNNALGVFLYTSGVYRVEFEKGYCILEITTSYPFEDSVTLKCIESTVDDIDWLLRIPYKADSKLYQEGKSKLITNKDHIKIKGLKSNDSITLEFDFDIKTIINPDKSISVQRGPLLFAQYIDFEEIYIKGKTPFHDRGYKPKEVEQNIALTVEDNNVKVKSIKKSINEESFYDNDIYIIVEAYNLDSNESIDLELRPYGFSTLRRTHFNKKSI